MRALPALIAAASKAGHFAFGYAVELDLQSGLLRINQSPYDITIEGNTFIGAGDLADVSNISETATLQAKTVTLSLSMLNPNIAAEAASDLYHNRAARLWACFFDESHVIIPSPYYLRTG